MVGGIAGLFLGALVQLGKATVREGIVRVLLQRYVERPNCPIDSSHFGERKS